MAVYVHPRAVVEGDVRIGPGSSIWACAVLRGDEGWIVIGKNVSVQENCSVHGTGVRVGDNVSIGHNAVVHGCKIGSNCIIGMGAIVLSGARIGPWCIVGAGAVVTEGAKVPAGSLVLGVPGRVVRKLAAEDRERITWNWKDYVQKAERRLAKAPRRSRERQR